MTAVKQTIGVIGSLGDLGSQLVRRAKKYGFLVREFDTADRHTNTEELSDCEIVHVCTPLKNFIVPPVRGMIILHDSVMDTSRRFNNRLDQKAAVVHLLMNSAQRAVVASDQPNAEAAASHLQQLGFNPISMPVDEHDRIIARSQAPLALLCDALLPELFQLDKEGLLTPSGETLAETLRSRTLIWTPATRRAILRNPQLRELISELSNILDQAQPPDK